MENILVLADIHANAVALNAVLADVAQRYENNPPVETWFLGDLFGRGPEPVATWRLFAEIESRIAVAGNHDWGLLGKHQNVLTDKGWDGFFNPAEWETLLSHREKLSHVGLLTLNSHGNPVGGLVVDELTRWGLIHAPRSSVYFLHGGGSFSLAEIEARMDAPHTIQDYLEENLIWNYVTHALDAENTLRTLNWLYEHPDIANVVCKDGFETSPRMVLVGHYHQRVLYRHVAENQWEYPVLLDQPYPLGKEFGQGILISPGSVGFSRDRVQRGASYAVLAFEAQAIQSVTFHVCAFDRETVRNQMRAEGYAEQIIASLADL